MTTKSTRVIAATAGSLAALLLFAACSSSPSGSPTTTTKARATTTTTRAGAGGSTTSTASTTTAPPFNLKYNARSDITSSTCAQAFGAWQMKGTLKNSAKVARRYQIVVDFVTVPGNTVEDTKVDQVPSVAPGASANWSATGAAGIPHLTCVIRNVQAFNT